MLPAFKLSVPAIARIVAAIAILVIGACQTPPHGQAKVEAERHWNQVRGRVKLQLAEKEFGDGHFEQALSTAAEAIALDPGLTSAHGLLTRANLEMGKPASAQKTLDAAKQAGVAHPDLIYLQGVIFEQQGRIEAALARYTKARELDPTNVDYLVAQTECVVALDRPDMAWELLRTIKGAAIDDAGTVAVLAARVAELRGDPEGAAGRYRDAMAALGNDATVERELGLLLVRLGRFEEAVAMLGPLTESLRDDVGGGAVRRALATCYLAGRNAPAALEILGAYARCHPDDTLAQLLVTEAALECGDPLTALRSIEAAYQHEPGRPQVRLLRAVVQWRRQDHGEAVATLFDLLVDHPDDVEVHCLLAEVLRDRGRVEAAREHFKLALDLDPDCTWAADGLRSLPVVAQPASQPPTSKLTSAFSPEPSSAYHSQKPNRTVNQTPSAASC